MLVPQAAGAKPQDAAPPKARTASCLRRITLGNSRCLGLQLTHDSDKYSGEQQTQGTHITRNKQPPPKKKHTQTHTWAIRSFRSAISAAAASAFWRASASACCRTASAAWRRSCSTASCTHTRGKATTGSTQLWLFSCEELLLLHCSSGAV
jgi:hypothetical protein